MRSFGEVIYRRLHSLAVWWSTNGSPISSCPAGSGKLAHPQFSIRELCSLAMVPRPEVGLVLMRTFRAGHHSMHHFKTKMESSLWDQMPNMALHEVMCSSLTLVVIHRTWSPKLQGEGLYVHKTMHYPRLASSYERPKKIALAGRGWTRSKKSKFFLTRTMQGQDSPLWRRFSIICPLAG